MQNPNRALLFGLVGSRSGAALFRVFSMGMIACLLVGLAFTLLPGQAVQAAGPFTVNTTSDTHCIGFAGQGAPGCTSATDSGGHISLRSALEEASTAGGTTTINLPAGTYNLSLGDLVAGTLANTNITIQGAGAASTIINQTTSGRMVIVVNYNVTANVVFNLSNVTISGGSENENDPDGFGGNGGAILAGGSASAAGNSLSITNTVFSGNFCSPVSNAGCTGGAISMTGGGDLTVTNSTFSGNTASKNRGFGGGGAIYFDNGGQPGNVTITGSTFTNNTAQGNSTTGGVGGALFLAGGTGTTYTVTTNTFTGNAVNGTGGAHGGAIYKPSGTLNASFNYIVGNTSAGDASGLYVGNNAGSIGNAVNNWWGCNGGPSAAPCDIAVLGTPNQGGSMTVSPWIVLTNTASPNPIQVNQNTTLTADFLHNSTGGSLTLSQISLLIGRPVTWGNAVRGALSNTQNNIQSNGTATATFTASAAGAGSATATVDSGVATGSVTINKADTTTTITSETPDPTVTGQSYTVNFTMTSNTGSTPTAPTGSVTVSDGTNSCSGTIASGACTITSTTAGSKTLTATYSGDGNFNASASQGVAHTVNKADTITSIGGESANPSVVGQPVTVSYGVAVTSPGGGTPTGNVIVSDGTVSCTGTVAAGQCSLTFTSAGAKSVTATYAGDSNYNASPASAAASQQVNKADTTTTITSDNPDPSDVGQAVTVNYSVAPVAPGAGTPTGNVTVSDGVDSCTNTAAAGTCSITLTTSGARTLTASYAGDSSFNASTSGGEPHTVNLFPTTTVLTLVAPNPSLVGQSVTVQYSVTAASGTPTGNVTVSDGTVSCTGTVAAGQCALIFTSAGAKTLTAAYAGDTNYQGGTSAGVSQQVNKADTTITINSDNPDPSTLNQAVTVVYSVAVNSPGAGTPTGNVTVSDGTISCSASLAAGQCSLTFTSSGNRTLTATYAGDSNFNGSTSTGEPHSVIDTTTTTTITSDTPDPSVVGQAVPVQFTVTSSGGTPTGSVTVSDGTISCSASVATGQCSLTFTSAGARTLVASYAGDGTFQPSTSAAVSHQVNKADTTTAITSDSPDPSPQGTAVTVKYSVAVNSPGAGTPTGNVTVSDGVNNCTSTVTAGQCSITLQTSGARTLTATYAGDSNFNGSTSAGVPHTVGSPTTTTITSDSPDPSIVGQAVTVQYTVTSSSAGTPTGNVTVSDGTVSCTGTVAAGQCSLTFTAAGIKSLTATYAGDGTFNGSTSAAVTHTVNPAPTALLYNGNQIVILPNSFNAAALLSSSYAACAASQPVSFSLDRNPTTGTAGTYSLGAATTSSSGQAAKSVSTSGWQEGVYTITAAFNGTTNCAPSSYSATLTVGNSGDSANGGGWYTLSGSGRSNFGFTVSKTVNTCTSNCTYKGQLVLINNSKWRLKGTLSGYVKTATGKGAVSGTGNLYWWNQALNGGLGDWALAQSGVSFTANFYDSGKTGKSSTDTFGINIQYTPVSPQPSTLPNSAPQLLKGGNITVK